MVKVECRLRANLGSSDMLKDYMPRHDVNTAILTLQKGVSNILMGNIQNMTQDNVTSTTALVQSVVNEFGKLVAKVDEKIQVCMTSVDQLNTRPSEVCDEFWNAMELLHGACCARSWCAFDGTHDRNVINLDDGDIISNATSSRPVDATTKNKGLIRGFLCKE